MMGTEHPVIQALRTTLASSRDDRRLGEELWGRIHQLISGMVDGVVLSRPAADALREAIFAFVRRDAIPSLAKRDPEHALRLLKKIAAFAPYTNVDLSEDRPALEAAVAAKYPRPTPPTWPVIERLRDLALHSPSLCTLNPPVASSAFVQTLAEQGGALPEDVVALYGAFDGIELQAASAPVIPVFSLLSAESLEVVDAEEGFPSRVAVFHGGDEVQLCVYRDRKKVWWCSYEYEYSPTAAVMLDVPALLDFALRRVETYEELSFDAEWGTYFGLKS